MKRSKFLKILTGGALSVVPLTAMATAPVKKEPLQLIETHVAGYPHYMKVTDTVVMSKGMPLRMKREPRNKYDPRAITLYFDHRKIGYIPRAENRLLSRMPDGGIGLQARISTFQPQNDPWERVRVEVEMMRE